MSSRDGSSWFPEPRRKDKPPPSAATLLLGTLLPVVAVAGLVVALTGFRHTSHTAAGKAVSTGQVQITTGPVDSRQAFNDCMRSAGAGGGGRSGFGGGRFGSRPDVNKIRQAYEICRSILQSGAAPSVPLTPTTPTTPAPPPVA
jgi:hypothetical protein